MKAGLLILQIVLAVMITAAVLLQAQGSGLGATWSGGGETYHTRRGLEKVIFYFTIIAILLFALVSMAVLVV
ncbi:MAG: preprotein translocase subunit SecG [Patescibacteria group bacterium]